MEAMVRGASRALTRIRSWGALAGLSLLCAPSHGAPPRVTFGRLTSEHGLSTNWVLSVLRDHQGFLWVGTWHGLNRYDGHAFKAYAPSKADPDSLPSYVAAVLFEDSRGRLWVGGQAGLARYDPDRDAFVRYPHGPEPGRLGHQVSAILEERDGRLWVATEKGVALFDPERGVSRTLIPTPSQSAAPPLIYALARDRNGSLWVATGQGLFVIDRALAQCVPWRGFDAGRPTGLEGKRVEGLFLDEEARLWVGTLDAGLYRLDFTARRITHYLPQPNEPASLGTARVRRIAADRLGRIWIGTENGGLDLFDPDSGGFHHYRVVAGGEGTLGSDSIYALYCDRQGILWIGTYNDGLNYMSPHEQRFERVTAGPGRLSDSHVTAIVKDGHGDLWVGTDGGGLNRIDARTGRFNYYRHSATNPRTLGSDSVFAVLADEAGYVWSGGWASGLSRLDPRTGEVIRFRHDDRDPRSIVGDDVLAIRRLRTGVLLVGTYEGTDLLDRKTGTFRRLSSVYPLARTPRLPPAEAPAGSEMTSMVLADRRGNLWLVGAGRAQRVDQPAGETILLGDETEDAVGRVLEIYEDSRGTVWFGTEDGLQYLPASSGAPHPTRVEGLPGGDVANILEDSLGGLWVSTDHGLSRLLDVVRHPTPRPSMAHFDVHDGLQASEFARGAAFSDEHGQLYFGGPRGLSVIRPEAISLNAEPPAVALTGFRVFGRPVVPGAPGSPLARSITTSQQIELSQDSAVITFEFAALNLSIPGKNRYSFRLDGFDHDWSPVSDQGTATYTRLPRGDYVFRVRAANNDGAWNDQGLTLAVRIRPRWHERLLTRVAVVLLAVAGLVAAFRWRVRKLDATRRELERRVDDRTRDLHQLNAELENRVASRTVELEEEKERLAVTLRSIGDAVIATDTLARVVLLNRSAEQLTGWSLAEALGRPLGEILPIQDAQTGEPLPDPVSVVLGGKAWELPAQARLVRRDGGKLLIADSAAPICDRTSRTIGVVLVFRDVTERSRMEEQIQNAQKLEALGVLAGGIAHDFNNLLTGVFGYVDLANRQVQGQTPAADRLEKAMTVLQKARDLTGQLLTFSRGGEPVTAPFALDELLRKSIEFDLSGSNVVCRPSISADLWPVRGDRRQIGQVVDNLLLNARQAMPHGGSIELRAENVRLGAETPIPVEPGRYVRLEVKDQGVGIPPEVRSRIFEPFFTTKAHGTGLGLATSYSIIRKHGGHIAVESEPGRGTSFEVFLPASDLAVSGHEDTAVESARGMGRILVMDDEDYLRDVAREMLTALGYTVEVVASADDAVRAYERALAGLRPFDAVLLDLTIPGGAGGLALLPRLRAIDPGVRAIASSGYSGDPVMADPEAYGFVAQLTKPYAVRELALVIGRVLRG